jgi:hypothetical protein
MLEYSPIGVKFSPITAPRTLYTEKKKGENFQSFFVWKCLSISNFDAKTLFDIEQKKFGVHLVFFLY